MKMEAVTASERKAQLARLCSVLGPREQNMQVRCTRFNEMLNTRVELEFSAARLLLAAKAMADDPVQLPSDLTEEQQQEALANHQQRCIAEFDAARRQLQDTLARSFGHIPSSNPGVQDPATS